MLRDMTLCEELFHTASGTASRWSFLPTDKDGPIMDLLAAEITACMLSDADADRPLGSIKLRARLKQIERRPDRRRACRGPGRLVVTTPQPGSETFATNGPSFAVAVCYEIGVCDSACSVKHFLT